MKANYKAQMILQRNIDKGKLIDKGIEIGLMIAVNVLHNDFSFGADRAFRFSKSALDMINNEFKRNAEPLTQEYEENVDVALVHLNRDFKKILGEKYTKFIDE